MMTSYCSKPYLNQILSRTLVVGTLATIGFITGLIPSLSKDSSTLVFSAVVYAQAGPVTEAEVRSYAQAVLAMEPLRQSAYGEIKKLIGSRRIPEIVCGRPQSISALPGEAQAIARSYCNQSSAIVANYFPREKTARFNEITSLMQANQALRTRIQNELVRLQQ